MCDRHVYLASLGDGRGSWPWPDCLWLSRHQDRRRFSGLAGGVVGLRPGLVAGAFGAPNPCVLSGRDDSGRIACPLEAGGVSGPAKPA